ncbi:hypothetical protein D9Q98_000089 [Chlorella vulgaris]|uniref:EamA domain-containing protein n=1 Tax=Chlorella vulgaris TaxID=3077 RepID=A0A9D4TXJ0_CHLVU|nr:hypothetical protein D9Q98_000089 [Chlorella vulgaris]
MGLVAKIVGGLGVPVFEIVLARSLVVLMVSGTMVGREGRHAQWPWKSERRLLLLLRGLVGFCAISCFYAAVQLLPLADVAVLTFLSPVFVTLLSPLVLGEGRGGWVVAAALPLCFVGVLLVAQPTFLFGEDTLALSTAGVAIAIAQAVFMASAKFCVRALGKSESVGSIMLSMAGVSVVGSTLLAAIVPGQALLVPPSGAVWALLAGTGLLACCVQTLATYALKMCKATPVTLVGYLSVVWGTLGDLLVYNRKPSALGLAGAALVCSSSLIIIFSEKWQAGAATAPAGSGGGGGEELDSESGRLLPNQAADTKAQSSTTGGVGHLEGTRLTQQKGPLV